MVRRVKVSSRLMLRRMRRYVVHRILHADDPPRKIALGAAIGMFITFTPTVGFQMILVVFLAWLLRANKLVGIPIVWLSNPVTIIPIYYPCYLLGCFILGVDSIGVEDWPTVEQLSGGWWDKVTVFWAFTLDIFWGLWIGGIIVGGILGSVTYGVVLTVVKKYRKVRPVRVVLEVEDDCDLAEDDAAALLDDDLVGESVEAGDEREEVYERKVS